MFRNPEFNLENEYIIQGYQFGLRELRQNSIGAQNATELYVKNNVSGEWEAISDILPGETE